jgi:2-oxoisovalerate dehydrogenase E1 component
VLRDIPGIAVAVPARADDALALFRAASKLATQAGRALVIVEPIALYHRRDLLSEGDGRWLSGDPGEAAELGRARVYRGEARDLSIVTYGNGVQLSLAAAERLAASDGIEARVLDLRWVTPLPEGDVLAQARATGRVLVVDECRHSGNLSEQIAAVLLDAGYRAPFARVTSADCFIPLGDAAERVLVSEAEIVDAARALMQRQT